MTLFYRGPCARITHEVFEVLSPYYRSFAIRELQYVHVVRETAGEQVVGSAEVTVCSTALAGVSAMVAAAGWPMFDRLSMSVVAVVALAGSSALAAASWRIRARPQALWALHRGRIVCLFQTSDRHMFGQVRRALLRVLELNDDVL